MSKTPPLVGS